MSEHERRASNLAADEQNYNGYANYPTWVVHLWLANYEDTYYESQRLLARVGSPVRGASALKSWVESQNPITEASIFAELLGWALQAVDWDEVARALGPEEWELPKPSTAQTT